MRWPCISSPRRWPSSVALRRFPGRGCVGAGIPAALLLAWLLAGCSSTPERELGEAAYDSYPDPAEIPADLALIPDAEPRAEPLSRYGNPPEYEVFGRRYRPLQVADGFEQHGLASWYGTRFHGRRTSSGEPYDMYAMTAAHKRLPLPSYVEVENLHNGKRVVVRVNDRGPFVDGRIIDLSYAAAHRLEMTDRGVAPVRIRVVGPDDPAEDPPRQATVPEPIPVAQRDSNAVPSPTDAEPATSMETGTSTELANGDVGGQFVQVGAFGERQTAERLGAELAALGLEAVRVSTLHRDADRDLYRVRIGPLADDAAVREVIERLQGAAHADFRIVRE